FYAEWCQRFPHAQAHYFPKAGHYVLEDALPEVLEYLQPFLAASWWEEMVTDIIETPDFCEPDESPQQVLEYAKDVVSDYIRKRVSL
ncbi:MAG: DUF2065 domain-containing protein, partial [Candidatus Electrothrix sp. AR1]|nr:DUF2065 domain-containing protein [Candidatus Electrothrix sp. AR1]